MTAASPGKSLNFELLRGIAAFLRSRRAAGYLVGGSVRDALLYQTTTNLDIAVDGVKPSEVGDFLRSRHGFTRPVVFSRSNTVFTNDGLMEVEISPLRGSVKTDCLERDFTVNCLYIKLTTRLAGISRSNVLDPTGRGIADLRRGTLRPYPDAFTPFAADPIRLLRAVRFSATLGFEIDEALKDSMSRMAFLITRSAAERIRTELESILVSTRIVSSFRLMQKVGLLAMVLPEVEMTAGFEQGSPHHAYDLLTHTLKATTYVEAELMLRLAALLHDVGKVYARRRKGDRMVYYGHEKISARMAQAILRRLKFPGRITSDVAFVIENHMVNYADSWTDAAVRRFLRRMGRRLDAVLSLAEADRKAHTPEARMGTSVKRLRKRIAAVTAAMAASAVSFTPPLDGHRIMSILGIDQGPDVGRAKEYLLQAVLRRGRPVSEEEAVRLLKRWATCRGARESR